MKPIIIALAILAGTASWTLAGVVCDAKRCVYCQTSAGTTYCW